MISRRAADSAGLSRRRIARWRWRGRVNSGFTSPSRGGRREASGGGCGAAITPTRRSDDRRPPLKGEVKAAIPAMATSMASTRFSASRFFSIAAFQSIDAFLDPGRRDYRPGREGRGKALTDFLAVDAAPGASFDEPRNDFKDLAGWLGAKKLEKSDRKS